MLFRRKSRPVPYTWSPNTEIPRCECGECMRQAIQPKSQRTIKYDGIPYTFTIWGLPCWFCPKCKEILYGTNSNRVIYDTFREYLGLTFPTKFFNFTPHFLSRATNIPLDRMNLIFYGFVLQTREEDKILRRIVN